MSHRSHRFTQISSLQATVVTMPHSNRYFSARELRIFFRNTNCTNYTNMLLSLERFGRFGRFEFKNQYSTLFFKSHTDLTDLTDFFRCKQRFVYHQDCVSTIFQVVTPISFFEKCYICSPPQYRSALVATRMRKNSLYDSKSLLFLISKSFGCFKYLKDALEILGGQSSKILSFQQFL